MGGWLLVMGGATVCCRIYVICKCKLGKRKFMLQLLLGTRMQFICWRCSCESKYLKMSNR